MLVSANGLGVVSADFVLPLSRAWHSDITVAGTDPSQLNGQVKIVIADGALTLVGTAKVEDVYLDTLRARVIAGAGGLNVLAQPKFYQQSPLKIVLSDLLTNAGETLSSTADASVLATQLDAWTVTEMPTADAIERLMNHVGADWRMLADGTFWCGRESWPDSGLEYTIEQEDKAHQQLVVTMEAPLLMPGTALGGRNVSYVETHVDHKTVRSTAWLVTASSTDRMRDPFVGMAKSALPQIDFLAFYRCQVAGQSADWTTLDLIPDDPRLPSSGLRATLRHGLPGCKVQVPQGTFVRLGWDGGDPSKPFCALWDGGESVTTWSFGLTPDGVLTKADMTALISALNGATAGGNALTWTPPVSFASSSFKVQR